MSLEKEVEYVNFRGERRYWIEEMGFLRKEGKFWWVVDEYVVLSDKEELDLESIEFIEGKMFLKFIFRFKI